MATQKEKTRCWHLGLFSYILSIMFFAAIITGDVSSRLGSHARIGPYAALGIGLSLLVIGTFLILVSIAAWLFRDNGMQRTQQQMWQAKQVLPPRATPYSKYSSGPMKHGNSKFG